MRPVVALTAVAWLAAAGPAAAIDADQPLEDPEQQALYEQLTAEVRCLVCQNQPIADSTAPLAADLRREIRGRLEAGQGEAEIKHFLTERYGDFVLYRPRFTAATGLLWLAPALLVGGGLAWLVLIVRRRAQLPITSDEQDAF